MARARRVEPKAATLPPNFLLIFLWIGHIKTAITIAHRIAGTNGHNTTIPPTTAAITSNQKP